jgi:hypothetical protein
MKSPLQSKFSGHVTTEFSQPILSNGNINNRLLNLRMMLNHLKFLPQQAQFPLKRMLSDQPFLRKNLMRQIILWRSSKNRRSNGLRQSLLK